MTSVGQAAKPDVSAAENAARDELPDIPIWNGARFEGTATSDDEICVDRIMRKEEAAAVGGERTSHVVVSWPDLVVGEPQDGPCADAAANAEAAIRAGRRYYLQMDSQAIALEAAVMQAQDGDSGAAESIAQLRERILARVNGYLLDWGETSIGGNLLVSAATAARDAAETGDLPELARQRSEIIRARGKLAEEAAG